MMLLERQLHDLGYLYVGQNSLYNLTWIELFRIIDASELQSLLQKDVRPSDLKKFEQFEARLQNQR